MGKNAPGLPWRVFLVLLYGATLGLLGFLAWRGSSYYLTPLIERPRHPDFWALKPGGTHGIVYGITGASLMVLMLAYSLRRRWSRLRNWAALRYWLDLHIFCGVVGPLFIVLHSSFKVQGLVALSFWSMVAVAMSGVLGRYLYLQIPRAASGDRMTLTEIEKERRRLAEELLDEESISEEDLAPLSEIVDEEAKRRDSLWSLFVHLPLDRFRLKRRLKAFAHSLGTEDHHVSRRWIHIAWQRAQLERRLRLLSELQSMFHYWHVIHKPFAVIMYLFMLVHIGVATMTGYVPGLGG